MKKLVLLPLLVLAAIALVAYDIVFENGTVVHKFTEYYDD